MAADLVLPHLSLVVLAHPELGLDRASDLQGNLVFPPPLDVMSGMARKRAIQHQEELGGQIEVTGALTIGLGTSLPEEVSVGAVEEGALGVSINALEIPGLETGTVIPTEDVPDFVIW